MTNGEPNRPGPVPEHHEAHDAANMAATGPFKEPVNAITHLIGALFAAAATVVLLVVSDGSARSVVSLAIYGVSSCCSSAPARCCTACARARSWSVGCGASIMPPSSC